MSFQNILVETRGNVGLVTLNRPKALNALSEELMQELASAVDAFETNEKIGCIVISGTVWFEEWIIWWDWYYELPWWVDL